MRIMKKISHRLILTAVVTGLVFTFSAGALAQEGRMAVISEMHGAVEVRLGGGEWQPAIKGMILHEKDEILTTEGGFVELLLDKKDKTGKLTLEENTRLRLAMMTEDPVSEDKATLLELAIGEMLVRVKKLQGNSKFEVKTPTSTTGVRGTVFKVTVLNK